MFRYSALWLRGQRQKQPKLHPLYRSYLARLRYYLYARPLDATERLQMVWALGALAQSGQRKRQAPERCFGVPARDFAPALLGRLPRASLLATLRYYLRSLAHALLGLSLLALLGLLADSSGLPLTHKFFYVQVPAMLLFYALGFGLFHLLRRRYICQCPVWLWRLYLTLSLLGLYLLVFLPARLLSCGLVALRIWPLFLWPLLFALALEAWELYSQWQLARSLKREPSPQQAGL